MAKKKQLGQILMEAGVIDQVKLDSALNYQKKWGGRLGRVLVDNDWITEENLVAAIHDQTGIELIDLDQVEIRDEVIAMVPVELVERHTLLPVELRTEVGRAGEILVLAVADPTDLNAHDEVQFYSGKKIEVMLASESSITRAIKRCYYGQSMDEMSEDFFQSGSPADIHFRGQDLDADDLLVVEGRLESTDVDALKDKNKIKDIGGSDWSQDAYDDPFADLDSSGKENQQGRGPNRSDESHISNQLGGDVVEDDLPEVEIVEDLSWDANTTQPETAIPIGKTSEPVSKPMTSPDSFYHDEQEEQLSDIDENSEGVREMQSQNEEEAQRHPEGDSKSNSFSSRTSRPLADSSWLADLPQSNDFDFFDSVPTNASAFGISGDLLGSESLLEKNLKETNPDQMPVEYEQMPEDTQDGQISQDDDSERQTTEEIESPFRPSDLLDQEAGYSGLENTPDLDHTGVDTETIDIKNEKSTSLITELADEVQILLEKLESNEVDGEPPTVAKSSHLIAAVIRILIKKGVFSDIELLEELKQR